MDSFKYLGTDMFLMDACTGSITIKDDTVYVGTSPGIWSTLNTSINCLYEEKTVTKIVYPTNCKNCGAILHDNICDYCGSDNGEYKRY